MAEYRLVFRRSVSKDLRNVPKKDLKRILKRIEGLAAEPLPPACEKLAAGSDRYRIRQGAYRIIYSINDDEICVVVVKVAQRKDAYR